MAESGGLFIICSLLMAPIFAYSATVQLNDPDWYFWFPLYACACFVNLVNWNISSKTIIRKISKVVIEDFVSGKAGFWSLDLSERVVREKTGSGLVIISLIMHLEALSETKQSMSSKNRKKRGFPTCVEYGMAILVAVGYGLPVFFIVRNGEMRFDQLKDGHP